MHKTTQLDNKDKKIVLLKKLSRCNIWNFFSNKHVWMTRFRHENSAQ